MNKGLIALLGVLSFASLALGQMPPSVPQQSDSVPNGFKPIVAAMWGDGTQELVITPVAGKLAPLGLKPGDLRVLQWQRFTQDEWVVTVKKQKIRLDQVAILKIRKLYAPPFTVNLPDGRKAIITPKMDRIARYHVPGHFFETEVRTRLSDLFVKEPGEFVVLTGLRVPGGQIPNFWGSDHIHISMGEPINTFANVKVEGVRGPQAADLVRMRAMRRLVEITATTEKSTPQSSFEAKFGTVPANKNRNRIYSLARSRLQITFEGKPPVIGTIFYIPGEPAPAQGTAAQARAIAQVDRDFLLAFFSMYYRDANQQERDELRAILETTASTVEWTEQEREKLLDE